MLNFAICDNNAETVNNLSHILESIFISNDLEANVALNTTNCHELLQYMDNNQLDVILMGIIFNSKPTGLKIAKKIREKNKDCYLIFVTEHSEYVFLAYKYKTFDFLCKPISKNVLEETVLRLFEDINENHSKQYIKLNNKNMIIAEKEISYIRREGSHIIFSTNSKEYKIYTSLNKLQKQLPDNFIRCHKSFIANINNIIKIDSSSNQIYFKNEQTCDIGAKYKSNFMKGVEYYGNK